MCGQNQWRVLAKPTSANLNRLQFLDSLKGWVVGDGGTIIKTVDGGRSWLFQDSQIHDNIIDLYILNDRLGWALAFELPTASTTSPGSILLKTTNGGNEWQNTRYPGQFFRSIEFLDSLHGWMGGEYGVLLGTNDGGSSWFEPVIDSSLFSGFTIRNIKFFSPQYGYAIGGHYDIAGVVWKTTDFGQRWTIQGVDPEPLNGLWYFDSLHVMCVGGDFDFGASTIQTTDGGEKWDYHYTGIFGEARAISFRTEAEAWAPLGFTRKYMCSLDSGRTWNDMYSPDSSAMYDVAFTDSRTGYMVGERGTILKFKPKLVDVHNPHWTDIPSNSELYQNYPNPFNPSTIIRYILQERSVVTMRVFDLSGKEIKTLYDGIQSVGLHEVLFDASGLACGIYLCAYSSRTLSSQETHFSAKKMLLIK